MGLHCRVLNNDRFEGMGKIKPINNEKIQILREKVFPWVSGSILELKICQSDKILSLVHPGTSTSGTGLGANNCIPEKKYKIR